jgi:hypothetical protein
MQQTSQRVKLMQILIVLLSMGGAIWWGAVEMLQPARSDDLKIELGDLRSALSEAARIIEQTEAGNITVQFFQVELALLRDQAEKTRKNIAAAKPQPGLEGQYTAARTLAATGRDSISRLLPLVSQRQRMKDEQAALEKILQQTAALEERLKQ